MRDLQKHKYLVHVNSHKTEETCYVQKTNQYIFTFLLELYNQANIFYFTVHAFFNLAITTFFKHKQA